AIGAPGAAPFGRCAIPDGASGAAPRDGDGGGGGGGGCICGSSGIGPPVSIWSALRKLYTAACPPIAFTSSAVNTCSPGWPIMGMPLPMPDPDIDSPNRSGFLPYPDPGFQSGLDGCISP